MSKTETQTEAQKLSALLAVAMAFEHGRIGTDRRFVEMDATVVASVDSELRRLDAENKALRGLAATCYAGLGAECSLPENWLDTLNAAANGEAFDTEGLLPFTAPVAAVKTGDDVTDRELLELAVAAEREACAQLAQWTPDPLGLSQKIAAAIRDRGQKQALAEVVRLTKEIGQEL